MNTQEIISELTKNDRLAIKEVLFGVYSRRYIDYMFDNRRRRTSMFRETVKAYWEGKRELTDRVGIIIHKFNNKEEELV